MIPFTCHKEEGKKKKVKQTFILIEEEELDSFLMYPFFDKEIKRHYAL